MNRKRIILVTIIGDMTPIMITVNVELNRCLFRCIKNLCLVIKVSAAASSPMSTVMIGGPAGTPNIGAKLIVRSTCRLLFD